MFSRNDIINLLKRYNDPALSFATPLPEIQIEAMFGENYLPTTEGMAAVGKKPKQTKVNGMWDEKF